MTSQVYKPTIPTDSISRGTSTPYSGIQNTK